MDRRFHDKPILSAQRAFVVHLGPGGGPRRRRFQGRVEHLSSGRAALFSSVKELLGFLTVAGRNQEEESS